MILDICSRLVAEDPCDVELPPVFWNRSGFFEANLTFPLERERTPSSVPVTASSVEPQTFILHVLLDAFHCGFDAAAFVHDLAGAGG